MAIRAWLDGDLRLAVRLLQWATPSESSSPQESSGNGVVPIRGQANYQAA
jgi:hypothetical protein